MVIVIKWILSILAILGIIYIYQGYTEGFITTIDQNYGKYPNSIDEPLLESYPSKHKPINLSDNTYQQNSIYRPMTEMSSYEQITNNFRFWDIPNNSSCSPADFCNTLYGNKNVKKYNTEFANIYDLHRVNMYDTK